MSKNGKLSLTPKAKEAAERFSTKAFAKALRLDKFGPQMETQVADMCREAWAAGYFYAKQESELYGDRQHLQHGLPGGDEADPRRND